MTDGENECRRRFGVELEVKAKGVDDFYVCPLARWRQTAFGKAGRSGG